MNDVTKNVIGIETGKPVNDKVAEETGRVVLSRVVGHPPEHFGRPTPPELHTYRSIETTPATPVSEAEYRADQARTEGYTDNGHVNPDHPYEH